MIKRHTTICVAYNSSTDRIQDCLDYSVFDCCVYEAGKPSLASWQAIVHTTIWCKAAYYNKTETPGSTKLRCFVGMHPTEATKTEAEHVPIGISFYCVMTHIHNCVKAWVSTVTAFSCLDRSILLCMWWKTLSISSPLKQGKPKQALITLVLNNMAVPTVGHDSAHAAGTLHQGIHHCFRVPLWKELRAHTHPALLAFKCQIGRPVCKNVLLIISQLSIVYAVTKDNKFVTKHQTGRWVFLWGKL